MHHLPSPPYTPAFNVETHEHALAAEMSVCVRNAEQDEQQDITNQKHEMPTILNAGVKGGKLTQMAKLERVANIIKQQAGEHSEF